MAPFLIALLWGVLWLVFPTTGKTSPKKIKVKLYKPHRGQLRIHNSRARFRVVACGRRYGKTLMACNELVRFALEHKNVNCAWIAPWYRQSKIAYRLIRRALKDVLSYKSDSDLRIELPNGSVIQFYSAENYEALRGNGFHFVVIDEAGDALKDPKAWTEAIRPTLSDTNGKALIIGTPKGRNLFFQLFTRGDLEEYPEWASFHAPTSDNPFIKASEIASAKQELPDDTFSQEYLAVFLEESAGVFKGVDGCVVGTLDPNYKRIKSHTYAVGFDPAKYQDYSVVTLIDCHVKRVVGWLRINQIDYTVQLEMVATIAEKYGAHVLMDMTGVGDPLLEQLEALGQKRNFTVEGYLFTNASKKVLIEELQIAIQNRIIEFPDIPVLVNELRIFEYVMTKSRQLSYSAPAGAHDDAVISLALAWHAAKQPSGPRLWSVNDDEPERTNEMPAQPEERKYTVFEIEKWAEPDEDEGEWYHSDYLKAA